MAGYARGILFRIRIGVVVLVASAVGGRAHDAFSDYVFHRVEFRLREGQLDVTVKLTFFEEWSERERRRMDENGDGHVGREELAAYAGKLAGDVTSQVSLSVAGQSVPLIPLYEPEIDLLGRPTVERGHHQLILHFFARTPAELAPGVTIEVASRLWPQAPAFGEAATAGGETALSVVGFAERGAAKRETTSPLKFTVKSLRATRDLTP